MQHFAEFVHCFVIFIVDGQEMLSRDFTWEDNKTFPPFVCDEKWAPGPHQFVFEVQPLSINSKPVQPQLDMRIDYLAVQGPLEEKYWSRPKNYDRFFTKDPSSTRTAASWS
jgi:hypothetical protein